MKILMQTEVSFRTEKSKKDNLYNVHEHEQGNSASGVMEPKSCPSSPGVLSWTSAFSPGGG